MTSGAARATRYLREVRRWLLVLLVGCAPARPVRPATLLHEAPAGPMTRSLGMCADGLADPGWTIGVRAARDPLGLQAFDLDSGAELWHSTKVTRPLWIADGLVLALRLETEGEGLDQASRYKDLQVVDARDGHQIAASAWQPPLTDEFHVDGAWHRGSRLLVAWSGTSAGQHLECCAGGQPGHPISGALAIELTTGHTTEIVLDVPRVDVEPKTDGLLVDSEYGRALQRWGDRAGAVIAHETGAETRLAFQTWDRATLRALGSTDLVTIPGRATEGDFGAGTRTHLRGASLAVALDGKHVVITRGSPQPQGPATVEVYPTDGSAHWTFPLADATASVPVIANDRLYHCTPIASGFGVTANALQTGAPLWTSR